MARSIQLAMEGGPRSWGRLAAFALNSESAGDLERERQERHQTRKAQKRSR